MVIFYESHNLKVKPRKWKSLSFVPLFNSVLYELLVSMKQKQELSYYILKSCLGKDISFISMKKLRHKNSLKVNAKLIFWDGYLHVFIVTVPIITSLGEAITHSNLQQNDLCKISEIGVLFFMLILLRSLL